MNFFVLARELLTEVTSLIRFSDTLRERMMEDCREEIRSAVQERLDKKTKPVGSLGKLEEIALRVAVAQKTLHPRLENPHLVLFAGDHGIADEGVSAYPKAVTAQMVRNFVDGGAAVSVLARQQGLSLVVVDAGVATSLDHLERVVHRKIGLGTKNMLLEPAMSTKEAATAIATGREIVLHIASEGCSVIGFGEMGIGNTSSAALLASHFTGHTIVDCVGRGTGLDDEKFERKRRILQEIQTRHALSITNDPLSALSTYGGFEIAMMVGGMLEAAQQNMAVLVDGFICSAAALVAHAIEPSLLTHCIFCHQSSELGHSVILQYLRVEALLNLNMRLGEGSGVAVAYPIIESSIRLLDEMATFSEAGVSQAKRE